MKKFFALFLILSLFLVPCFSQEASVDDFLTQGLQAYKNSNWDDAISLLKKAESLKETKGPETLYMLIMAQMFKGDYKTVLSDCAKFESQYSSSEYKPYVDYQKGRAFYYLGDYKNSISVFAKFCNENENNELFSSALFWMAENLYQSYHFEQAKSLLERVVNDYPNSPKYTEAVYRLDLIVQREKEEKLLYLLKVTSEEFLASKNDFERELRKYRTSENIDLRSQLEVTQGELEDVEKKLKAANEEIERLKKALENSNQAIANAESKKTLEGMEQLTEKAKKLQKYVDENKDGE